MSQEFGAVLVTGLAIFGLAFVSTQVDTGFIGTADTPEAQTYYQESFGRVGDVTSDARVVRYGRFTVGEGRGDVMAYRNEEANIRGSTFSSEVVKFDYNAVQPQGGEITFNVLSREGDGAIYVLVNGQKIFEEHVISGSSPKIDIPQQALESGENTVVIGSRKGGIISSTEHILGDVKVRISDRKFHDYVDTFQMYDYELEDFVEAKLSFNIDNSVKTRPLSIFVNGQQVYQLDRVRGQEEVELTPQNADLRNGFNTIRFQTEGEARYDISNTELSIRYVGRTREALIRSEFDISEDELNYAERNDTQEGITFDYQNLLGSQRQIVVDLNGNRHSLRPVNGNNEIRFPGSQLGEENVMIVRSNGTFQLNNFKVRSQLVEE